MKVLRTATILVGLTLLAVCRSTRAIEDDQVQSKNSPTGSQDAVAFSEPKDLTRLAPDHDIWVDTKRKLVVVDGKVVLRDGLLEMFACPKGTKEHESIVAVNSRAQFVHAGLVAVGADPGRPVSFTPEYKPATGPVIDVWVLWKDEQGKNQKARAQEWVQNTRTDKAMEHDWVFAGSDIYVDPETGKRHYLADGGDLICVSNFSSAMLDVPVPSSDSNAGLVFRAFTERIPPLGTPVRLVLQPRLGTPGAKSQRNTEARPVKDKPDESQPAGDKSKSGRK